METDVIKRKLKEISTKDIDEKGYIISMNPKDNLLQTVTNWDIIKKEIEKGQGNELQIQDGRMNFCA